MGGGKWLGMDDLTDAELDEIADSGERQLRARFEAEKRCKARNRVQVKTITRYPLSPRELSDKNKFVLAIAIPAIFIGLLGLFYQILHLPDFVGWILVGLLTFSIIRPFFRFFTKK